MNEAEILINKLQRYYNVGTLQALGEKIGVAQTTISGWSRRNSVKAISRKIYELNLPIEIENRYFVRKLEKDYLSRNVISKLCNISEKSYYVWKNKTHTKLITLLEKYFTKADLEEFLETGTIARLDTLEGLSVEDVHLLKDLKEVFNRRGNQC